MIVITPHDIAEALAWICIILFFVRLGSSENKQNEKSEDKRNDNDDEP